MTSASRAMKTRILVVEDEEDIRGLMQELLEVEGYSVDAACHGQDALDRLHACADADLPHLILLDLAIPGWPTFRSSCCPPTRTSKRRS